MRKRAFGLAVAMIVGIALVSASGALATTNTQAATRNTQTVTKINVSTRAAVVHYLRSIHVRAKGVVIQRGLRNYAGARCPDKHWNCAGTRHTVVQIAKPGGLNRFACGTEKCVAVQFGGASPGLKAVGRASFALTPPVNTASCVKTTGVTQSCTINQPNATGTNKAVVWMDTGKLTGLAQSAIYTASITQGPASATGSANNNLACVHQAVSIDGSSTKGNAGSVTVTSDAHQSISIQQNSLHGDNTVQGAMPSGKSFDCNVNATSPLTQDETLTSFVTGKGSITQKQDTATTGKANVVVDIEQNQGSGFKCASATVCPSSGTNNAAFKQTSDMEAVANTSKGPVIQTQSADVPNPPYSGIVGTINQDSSNTSTAHATQQETQCEDAVNVSTIPATCDTAHLDTLPSYSITQTQYGPLGVFTPPTKQSGRVHFAHKGYGQSGQTGNSGDLFFLTQTSKQDTDGGPHSTQKNIIVGDCASGTVLGCQAGQTATLNGLGINDGYTSPTITNLNISCTNGNGSCIPTKPPAPTIDPGSEPANPTQSRDATFTWTDPATGGVTFECSLDGASFSACSSGGAGATFSNLTTGSHTFKVRAVDTTLSHNASAPDSFTWTIVDANVSLSPLSATNEVGTMHTVTCTIKQDKGDTHGFVAAPNGTTCTGSVNTGGPNAGPIGSCTVTNSLGTCTITYSDTGGTGTDTIHATTTFSVSGVSMTRTTLASGTDIHNDGLDVTKTWVDANVSLSPLSATNEVGTSHTVTCTIQQDKGHGGGFVVAPDGTTCNGSVLAGGPNAGSIGSCTVTNSLGTCTISYTGSGGTGTDTIHATTTFMVGGVTLTRSTGSAVDSHQDGLDVTKTWVDANVSLSPLSATNEVGTSHTVTCTIQQDKGHGGGFVVAPDGTTCNGSVLAGGPNAGSIGSCTVTNSLGTCTISYTGSGGTGTDTIHATTTFMVGGVTLTRSTGSAVDSHQDGLDVTKTWVDANVSLSPLSATNEVGTSHTVTCTIQQDKGHGGGFVVAPDGTTCNGSVLAGGPNAGSIGSCTVTNSLGTCTITYSDTGGTGTDTIHATTTFSVSGVSMTRTTLASGTDIHNDGLDVTKTWVDANVSLSPLSATNEVGTSHTVTCTIQQDKGHGGGFVVAPDGTTCNGSVLAGGPNAGSIGSCTVTNSLGTCTISYTGSGGTGTDTIHATTTFMVGGVTLTRSTGSAVDSHQDGLDVTKTWVVPVVTNVTSSTADGTYGDGDTVSVQVVFSEPVVVDTTGGTPTLALNSGGAASYSSGSGSDTLTFSYTVGAGENSPDLDYVSTSSLSLNGGTIKDNATNTNAAVLTLPAPGSSHSLGDNKNIVIAG